MEQSRSWDKRKDTLGSLFKQVPFQEGLPVEPWTPDGFEIITARGEHLTASVDDSRKYRTEGIRWRAGDQHIPHHLVAAWRRLEPKGDPQ